MINNNKFQNGCVWLRVDFHLHTKADKEFNYSDDESSYVRKYVDGLKNANISVGVITNHNKFDFEEYKILKKAAIRENILLLPGIELSVNDGANGIHTLIVFSDEWLANGDDYINQFLNVAFEGKTSNIYENENGRSTLGLVDTIKKLEGYHRDFFIVFAHVEQRSGLWNELDGGRLQELSKNEYFCRRTLAFQKVRTHDVADRKCRVKVQGWLGEKYPAEVEGSDCKSIDAIGEGDRSFLKIGNLDYSAVKYALVDFQNRLSPTPLEYSHSYIKSVSFEGGVLNGKEICLSPELNSFIGIRGSGKSSILEAIRYVLDIPFGDKVVDSKYKNSLVEHTLSSGGKIVLRAQNNRGQEYEIRRILNEKPDVYINGELRQGISIRETILSKPIYFGQKDLSSSGEGFETDLVEKLVGEKLATIRSRIESQKQSVIDIVAQVKKLENVDAKKKEYDGKKKDANHRLEFYKTHGVEEKLQKQVTFNTDSRKIEQIIKLLQEYLTAVDQLIADYEDELTTNAAHQSEHNKEFFKKISQAYVKVTNSMVLIKNGKKEAETGLSDLRRLSKEFNEVKEGLKEEFANIERKLAEELKQSGAQAIKPEEFLKLKKILDQSNQMLGALEKQEVQQTKLNEDLVTELTKLNELWHEEYTTIQAELDKVNKNHSALQISAQYKGDKDAFLDHMKSVFRGSRIRENIFKNLVDEFSDFGAMMKEFVKVKEILGNTSQAFEEYFNDHLAVLLTWQVPNRYIIKYRNKELKHHSLGQRASALILFVLSRRENDLIMIDQPEDDLDNQTIYEDVIKLIRDLKFSTQFIFATHNANIPVLGDSERIIACSYADDKIVTSDGNIDCPETQKKIVDIMEGGKEAFKRRKEIYQIWKLQNS